MKYIIMGCYGNYTGYCVKLMLGREMPYQKLANNLMIKLSEY